MNFSPWGRSISAVPHRLRGREMQKRAETRKSAATGEEERKREAKGAMYKRTEQRKRRAAREVRQ